MNFIKYFFLLLVVIVQQLPATAQDTSQTRQELWPEINLYYRLNDKFRIYSWYSATKLKNSDFTDGGYGIALDHFTLPWIKGRIDYAHGKDSLPGYYLWLRAGYLHSNTPRSAKDAVIENTVFTEANGRFHIPGDILLTAKNRIDWRFVNSDFKPRYRCRLNFEKDMRTEYLFFTPYVYGEYFVNLYEGGAAANRFRLCAGSELKVAKHINFEMYFLYQFDNGKSVEALKAGGLALKFYFDHRVIKQKLKRQKGLPSS